MSISGTIIGVLFGALFSGLVIWIVGKLGLGLEVKGFGPAYVAAILIAILNGLVVWLLGALNINLGIGLLPAVINLIIAAVIFMASGRLVKGLVVKGFGGALIAAVAVALVGWLVALLLGSLIL